MARKSKSKSKSQQSASDSDVEALRAAIASLSAQTLASAGARYLGEAGLEKLIGLVRGSVRDAVLVLEVRTVPQDARVVMNGIVRNTLPVRYGAEVSWEAGADGYVTQSGSQTVTEDTTLEVELRQDTRSLTVNATPSSATIVITAGGTEHTGTGSLTVDVPYGETAEWKVSDSSGPTKRGSVVMTGDTIVNVEINYESPYITMGSGSLPAAAGTYDLAERGVVDTNAEYFTIELAWEEDWITVVKGGSGESDRVAVTANTDSYEREIEAIVTGYFFDGTELSEYMDIEQKGGAVII